MKKNKIQYQKERTHHSLVDRNTILKEEEIIQFITYSFGKNNFSVSKLRYSPTVSEAQ